MSESDHGIRGRQKSAVMRINKKWTGLTTKITDREPQNCPAPDCVISLSEANLYQKSAPVSSLDFVRNQCPKIAYRGDTYFEVGAWHTMHDASIRPTCVAGRTGLSRVA